VNRQEREAFERAAVDYLDGALDARAAEALRREAEASPDRRALFAQAEGLWQALHALGKHESDALPRVEIREAVLSAIAAHDLPADAPELEAAPREAIAAAARELFLDPANELENTLADEFRAQSGTHRQEFDACEKLAEDLKSLAIDAEPVCPPVDLRESILATIAGDTAASDHDGSRSRTPGSKVVSFQRGRMHRAQPMQWPLIAAAAVLLMLVGSWSLFMGGEPEAPVEPVAVTPAPEIVPETPILMVEPEPEPETPVVTPLENAFTRMAEAMPQPVRMAPKPESTPEPDLASITLDEIWSVQRAALADPGSRAAVRALAHMPADQARALVDTPGQDPDILVGAAASLPPAEARVALLTIREDRDPEPSRVFAEAETARAMREEFPEVLAPVDAPSLEQIIAELRAIDPDNALTYYWEAIDRLQEGDLEGALALLEAAEQLDAAHAYSLENARANQSALEAGGMSRDSAVAAAALSAGMSQYDFLTSLGQDLMDEAFRYDAMGHTEAAEQILTAAQRFGAQIENGSSMTWEQLAGLDLQRAAIEALESFFFSPDDLAALTNDALNLVASMESVASFIDAFNNLFLQPFDADFFTGLSQLILNQGDVDLFAHPQFPALPAQNQR